MQGCSYISLLYISFQVIPLNAAVVTEIISCDGGCIWRTKIHKGYCIAPLWTSNYSRVAIMVVASPGLLATLLLVLAIAITAKPVLERKSPIKLALSKRRNPVKHNVVERDRQRVRSFRRCEGHQDDSKLSSESTNTPANFQGGLYSLSVGCGNPPTFCT